MDLGGTGICGLQNSSVIILVFLLEIGCNDPGFRAVIQK